MKQHYKLFTTCFIALAMLLGSGVSRAAGELHLYNWSNYFSPDLIKQFEQETGTKVMLDTYASEEDLLAKL